MFLPSALASRRCGAVPGPLCLRVGLAARWWPRLCVPTVLPSVENGLEGRGLWCRPLSAEQRQPWLWSRIKCYRNLTVKKNRRWKESSEGGHSLLVWFSRSKIDQYTSFLLCSLLEKTWPRDGFKTVGATSWIFVEIPNNQDRYRDGKRWSRCWRAYQKNGRT